MINEFQLDYIAPVRIVCTQGHVENVQWLLSRPPRQSTLNGYSGCLLRHDGKPASVMLDFGRELHGHVALWTGNTAGQKPVRLRIRYGESVGEAMSELYTDANATNDHAVRDQIVSVPWLGSFHVSQSGFRFVRIDLMDAGGFCELRSVWAVSCCRNIPYQGSFRCSDERLNQIWQTGAYTVHLNMQEYLWDGIKRDRMVWVGDMHPETMTILSVFGGHPVVPKSLDLIRDITPPDEWMNGISSYSLWWILIHHTWYLYRGDLNYLRTQRSYLHELLNRLFNYVDADGSEMLPELRFLDWPSSGNLPAIHAGLQSLLCMTFERGGLLCDALNDRKLAEQCYQTAIRMKQPALDPNGSKQAGALMALAGLANPEWITQNLLSVDGCRQMTTFFGYYILEAMSAGGALDAAMDMIRDYWGAMLDLGATTFWEDFDIEWLPNAARIDELVTEGKKDIHGDFGNYCYRGYRHSLCHGWASGPTAWLAEHILGIYPVEPGFRKAHLQPYLGNLSYVDGTFPTPYGIIRVHCEKDSKGRVNVDVDAPQEIEIIQDISVAG